MTATYWPPASRTRFYIMKTSSACTWERIFGCSRVGRQALHAAPEEYRKNTPLFYIQLGGRTPPPFILLPIRAPSSEQPAKLLSTDNWRISPLAKANYAVW